MNLNETRPLSPEELFQKLLHGDYREAECLDETKNLVQQREILLSLICQYERQILHYGQILAQEKLLLETKDMLIGELQLLRKERGDIERRQEGAIETLRLTPLDVRGQQEWQRQLNEVKTENNRLRVKLKDVASYVLKLKEQNQRLHLEKQERGVLLHQQAAQEDWRSRLELMKREQVEYSQKMELRMRKREELNRLKIEQEQLRIQQRNRDRIYSFTGGTGRQWSPSRQMRQEMRAQVLGELGREDKRKKATERTEGFMRDREGSLRDLRNREGFRII